MRMYAAFLRGVSPMNAKMPELKKAFETAGFTDVRTVLSSGNVLFGAPASKLASLEKKAEAAMKAQLGKTFTAFVRSVEELRELIEADPYAPFGLPPGSKRIVTFLRERPARVPKLPVELDGARILAVEGREVLSAYVRSEKGPVFMTLIEKTFGKDVTTRTWETVGKMAK